jgi:two-component system NarL family sensor kinase
MPGGRAEAAGLRAGDVILSVDGVPFATWCHARLGQTHTLEIEREGQRFILAVPAISAVQFYPLSMASGVFVVMVYWGGGTLLLLRRSQQHVVRLLFLLAQAAAAGLLVPLAHTLPIPPSYSYWFLPPWLELVSLSCFYLAAPLLLHFTLTFPVALGTPCQRRIGLGLLYGLAVVPLAGLWFHNRALTRLGTYYTVLSAVTLAAVLAFVYWRRATPDDRRRLRLITLGTALAAIPPVLFYGLPAIIGAPPQMPAWLMGLFLVIAPLCFLYATARHNLFGIDRLLNRALVYALLSLGILALYVGPFLLTYRFLPDAPLVQMVVAAGLTLLVGLGFNWTRARVQRWVDRLFYGGWYDYPAVVEMVSDALARSLARTQLEDVLTRQVPEMMQLRSGDLWIGEPGAAPRCNEAAPRCQFPLSFEGRVRGVWAVGTRLDGDDFTPSDRRILQTLAHQAEVALSNVLLVEALRRRLDEIREMQHQLLRSREEEQARLARDLHDGPVQLLVGLNMQLGLLLSPGDDTPLFGELKAMRSEVRGLLSDLRQVCADLRPPMLDTLGLGAALRALADEWSTQHGQVIDLDLPPDAALLSLPEEVAVNLYRVAQEALANAARHATTERIALCLIWDGSRLELTIEDDGHGFVVPRALHSLTAEGHFGLVGMQERVNLIGGELAIDSAPGQGTTVRVVWHSVSSTTVPTSLS